jgi:hypothetical protein
MLMLKALETISQAIATERLMLAACILSARL